jgi:outer membrane protein assembly factor BamB
MIRILLLFSLLLLTGCGSLGWFSSDNVEEPAELVELENEIQPRTLWSRSVGGGSGDQRLSLVPSYADGILYAAEAGGEVKAFDAETGELVWGVDTGLDISGGPGVGDGLVLIGTSQAELVALHSETGAEAWRGKVTSEILSVPKAAEGVTAVHTLDGKIVGFDSASGDLLWLYDRSVPILTLHGSSSPVISLGRVICGTDGGKLVALDLATGDVVWESSITTPTGRTELERLVDIDSDPLVLDDVVYVTTYQGDTAAVSEDSGVLLWNRPLSSYAGLGVDWRQLYVSDDKGRVWAIDQRNGAAAWKNDQLLHRKLSAPAVLGDYVLVGDFDGYIHWLATEDGHMAARISVGGDRVSAKPLVVDGVAYIYDEGGGLTAVTLDSPEEQP